MSLSRGWAGLVLACLLFCAPFLLVTAEENVDKVAALRKHTAKAGSDQLVQFTDKSFSRFAFEAADRPYHLVLLLSANNCPACSMLKKAVTAVKVVADSLPERTPLFFAELNHEKNQKAFQSMGITHTPVLLFLPRQRPGEGAQPAQYQISSMEHLTSPDMVAKWLAHHSGLPVSMPQPLWKNAYVQNFLIAVALFFFLYKLPALLRNWKHPLVFFFGFMCVYAFTFSGVIYNAIHKLPWAGTNHHTGEVELFMSDMRAQYAGEGAIVAALNIFACLFVILLADWVPKIGPYWVRVPLFLVVFGGALLLWLAQVRLFSIHKASYYPFKL